MDILDIHTHHAVPQPQGVISMRVRKESRELGLSPTQRYSVGIHPWDTESETTREEYDLLDKLAEKPEVVAIGECGVDLNIGGPLFRQLQVFRHHVELSERLGKPLVIHDVKAHDIIVGARRDLKPRQAWAIHGFRQKPEAADMLHRAGCWLSFGPQFNVDTVREVPDDRILAETDESEMTIEEVIKLISEAKGRDMTETIAANSRRFLNGEIINNQNEKEK